MDREKKMVGMAMEWLITSCTERQDQEHAELNTNKYLMVNYFQFLDYNSLFMKIQMITCSY